MYVKIFFVYIPRVLICPLLFLGVYETFAGKVTFLPSFEIEQAYNENIFYLDRYKADDYIMILKAVFPLEFSDPSKKLTFIYSPYTELYRDFDQLDYTGHDFRSTYEYKGKISNFSIYENFSLTQRQGIPLEYESLPIGVLNRTDVTSNSFSLIYNTRIKSTSFVNIKVDHLLSKYEDIPSPDVAFITDFEDTTIFGAIVENLFAIRNRNNRIGYFYNFRKFQYEDLADQEVNSLGFIYRFERAENWNLMIKAGGFKISDNGFSQDKDIDALFYFDISKDFSRGNIRLASSRDAGTSGGFGGLSIDIRSFLEFTYNTSSRSSLGIISEYYNREPIEETFVEYDAYAIGSFFDFKAFKKLSFSLSHRYFIQSSIDDDFNGKYNVFSLSCKIYPTQ